MPYNGTKLSETAAARRKRELHDLAREGVPVVFEARWKARIGSLSVWPYSGSWPNAVTGFAGKMHSQSVRVLLKLNKSYIDLAE
jgi:hypothetical protein